MRTNLAALKVVVADDHPLVLAGLTQLLQREGVQVAAACRNGREALEAMRETQADIALVDLQMPELDGFGVFAAVRAERLPARIGFVAASLSDQQIFDAVMAGVHGLVLKEEAADVVLHCLTAMAAGDRWLPSSLVGPALQREGDRRARVRRVGGDLTPRELEIVGLIMKGRGNKEIAAQLNVAEGTVKVHLHNIFNKLGVANRTALAALALETLGL